jgi:hypothetical protein
MRFAVPPHLTASSQALAERPSVGASFRNGTASLPRLKRSRRFPWRLSMVCLALCGFLFAFSEVKETGQAAVPSISPAAAPLPAWIEIPRPPDIFRLEAPEFAGNAKLHVARRHRTGGGRQDIWEFGGSSENAPFLNLLIYQPGDDTLPESSFYVDLARRAAETGRAVTRAEQPGEMATRFGDFEVARLGLARDGASPRECLGFRFINAEPNLHITGFACGDGGAVVPPLTAKAALACLIEQIDLAPATGDKGLIDFFAAHYAIRSLNCPGQRVDSMPLHPTRPMKTGEAAPLKRQGTSRQR